MTQKPRLFLTTCFRPHAETRDVLRACRRLVHLAARRSRIAVLVLAGGTLTPPALAQAAPPGPEACALVSSVTALGAGAGPGRTGDALARAEEALRAVNTRGLTALQRDPALAPYRSILAARMAQAAMAVEAGDAGLLPRPDPRLARLVLACVTTALAPAAQGAEGVAVPDVTARLPEPGGATRADLRAVDPGPEIRQPWLLYLGFLIFALASYAMHNRNQEEKRRAHRHMCHLPTELRLGALTHRTAIKDISRRGARLTALAGAAEAKPGARVWLRIGMAWIAARIVWQNKAATGLEFDHPLRDSLVAEVLGRSATAPVAATGRARPNPPLSPPRAAPPRPTVTPR